MSTSSQATEQITQHEGKWSEEQETLLHAFEQHCATAYMDSMEGPVELVKLEYSELLKIQCHDGEFMLTLLPYYYGIFDYIPQSLKEDRNFMMGAVKISPALIQHFWNCEDVEVCRYVLGKLKRKDWSVGSSLRCFSPLVFENEDFGKVLVKKFPMFIHVSPNVCNNVKLIQIAIGNDGRAIRYASRELLKKVENRHLIVTAVKNSRKALYHLLNYIDSAFAKHPILSDAALRNFKKRLLCHTIPMNVELEMRKLFRNEFARAVKEIGPLYKDPITHEKHGQPIPKCYWEDEWVEFCAEEERRQMSHFQDWHDQFFGHFSDVIVVCTEEIDQ